MSTPPTTLRRSRVSRPSLAAAAAACSSANTHATASSVPISAACAVVSQSYQVMFCMQVYIRIHMHIHMHTHTNTHTHTHPAFGYEGQLGQGLGGILACHAVTGQRQGHNAKHPAWVSMPGAGQGAAAPK